ncbi:MAG: hypothetical protein EBV03_03935 [Proteobacteria bacterium]|nr:hypothetical protein [Pseudomonadota bacterium]
MSELRRSVLGAAAACWLTGATSLALMALLRTGLGVPWVALLEIMLCAGGVLFSPGLLPERWLQKPHARALAMAGALGLVFSARLHTALPLALYVPMLAAGLWGLRHGTQDAKGLAVVALATGLYIFCKSHAEHYAGVFTPELALLGVQHRDTLLHASFITMIYDFGQVTLGQGGMGFIPYHIGVHVWLGPVSAMLGLPPVEAMGYVLRGIIFPCLLMAALLAVPRRGGMPAPGMAACMAMLLALMGLTELFGMYSNWLSESHAFSIIFLFLALSCLPEIFAAQGRKVYGPLLAFCALALLAQGSKLTVGMLLLGMGAGLGLWHFRLRPPALVLLATLCAGAWYVKQYQLPVYTQTAIFPLYLMRAFGPLITLSSLLPLLLLAWLHQRVAPLPKMPWVGVGLCAAGALGISNSIAVIGGSGWYFMDVIRWVGIWALGLWLAQPQVLARFPLLQEGAFDALYAAGLRKNKPHMVLALLLVLAMGDAAYGIRDAVSLAQAEAQRQIAQYQLVLLKQGGGLLGREVATAARQGYGAQLLAALEGTPKDGHTAVYIRKGSPYWRWPEQCDGASPHSTACLTTKSRAASATVNLCSACTT